ncbi:tetratricopeptide repeat protein [Azospirillum sp.]|uniref:tetratricopeptide repeat protein n=1 Tax=Azospirillum sp. TaxID=34012 RepID=UPI002D40ADDA|nr:tetratricopeptide repeat protein [Azospirillum sp.]HYD64559.1 tetratricopeptide repeat protein [Azospirillum sp.]
MAARHLQAARLPEARQACERVLAVAPEHPPALHLLGMTLIRQGRVGEGEALIRRVLALQPDAADALSNLAVLLKGQGRLDEAIALSRRAVDQRPDHPEIRVNLGNALLAAGRPGEAAREYRHALGIRPDWVDTLERLADALMRLGQREDAGNLLAHAIILRAGLSESRYSIDHGLPIAKRLAAAEAACRRLVASLPDHADAHFKLAGLLQMQGRGGEAVEMYHRVLALDPGHAQAMSNLGVALRKLGRLDEAFEVYDMAVRTDPTNADTFYNYGNGLQSRGRLMAAIANFRRAVELRPGLLLANQNLLTVLNYTTGLSRSEVFAEHRAFAARHAAALAGERRATTRDRDPERRLRVGYVSPDFWRHSCAYFTLPLLSSHDRRQVEVVCYSDVKRPDTFTQAIRANADLWRETFGVKDAALADLIRADGIDILVDLNGHFADSRILTFARKPAPVQVTWLGYPNTTGLDAMDYRLVDAVTDPPGDADPFHTEKLVRLAPVFLCYRPSPDAPEPVPPPGPTRGYVTFGSFNNVSKITDEVVTAWAGILAAVPGSRLFLKARQLDDAGTRRRLAALFEARGIAPDRLDIRPWSAMSQDHLSLYGEVDVALDPFPYNGTTTTCEALWMGVPVVSLRGDRHAGRVGASLLSAVGLGDLVAGDAVAYHALAVALAQDTGRLTMLRMGLRERMRASPLCDGPGFARRVEGAYRAMWRRWCAGQPPVPFALAPGPAGR